MQDFGLKRAEHYLRQALTFRIGLQLCKRFFSKNLSKQNAQVSFLSTVCSFGKCSECKCSRPVHVPCDCVQEAHVRGGRSNSVEQQRGTFGDGGGGGNGPQRVATGAATRARTLNSNTVLCSDGRRHGLFFGRGGGRLRVQHAVGLVQ